MIRYNNFMYKVAESFFKNNFFYMEQFKDFWSTDLCSFFKDLYGEQPEFTKDKGFIKIYKAEAIPGGYVFYENIFYDYTTDLKAHNGIDVTFFGYLSFPSIHDKLPDNPVIKNTFHGRNLSKNGFTCIDIADKFTSGTIELYPQLDYSRSKEEVQSEAYGSKKFTDKIWDQSPEFKDEKERRVYNVVNALFNDAISFSDYLSSSDLYSSNFLEWKPEMYMRPHNGVDYRSLVNLITHNTTNCSESRALVTGEFDWYNATRKAINSKNFDQLLDIPEELIKWRNKTEASSSRGILVNVFNPKFFHEVEAFSGTGELYTCTANKTYSGLTGSQNNFNW